jgi:hypothetical protein
MGILWCGMCLLCSQCMIESWNHWLICWNRFILLKLGGQLKIRFADITPKVGCLKSSPIIEFFELVCLILFLGRVFGTSKPLLRWLPFPGLQPWERFSQ